MSFINLTSPFVRTGWEFRECKRLIEESGLTNHHHLELLVMAELPSIISWLAEYVRLGVTGVAIGPAEPTRTAAQGGSS